MMKWSIWILLLTIFLIVNTYYDGKYTKILMSWKKYYQMIFIAILGFGIYLMIQKNPMQCRKMLMSANNMMKYVPIDKSSLEMFSPILDMTSESQMPFLYEEQQQQQPQRQHKRTVSETKKKYVASQQNWKCGQCQAQLNHTFEIDHKKRLEYGGSNEVENLIALCRNCHGNKTAMENM